MLKHQNWFLISENRLENAKASGAEKWSQREGPSMANWGPNMEMLNFTTEINN